METATTNVFATFKALTLSDRSYVPSTISLSKSVQLGNLLILLNSSSKENSFVVFDLEEKRFLSVNFQGEKLKLTDGWSLCSYGLDKVLVLEADSTGSELTIGFICVHRKLNEILMKYEKFVLQGGPVYPFHSASIHGKNLILYGGSKYGATMDTLTLINLETFSCETKTTLGSLKPVPLYDHKSLLHGDKLYLFGGKSTYSKPNLSIYVLDLVKYQWSKLTECPKQYATAQVDKDYLYFFGDPHYPKTHSHLAIFSLKEELWYQVFRKGENPVAKLNYTSALCGGQMILFGEISLFETEQIYSLILEERSLSNYIREMGLQMEFSEEENKKDAETLLKAKNLFKDENYVSDIVFKVQNQEFSANKGILSLRSSFFSNMFSSGMRESYQNEIILDDISEGAFDALLNYLYEGILPSENEIIEELLKYSGKILLKRLEVYCEKALLGIKNSE